MRIPLSSKAIPPCNVDRRIGLRTTRCIYNYRRSIGTATTTRVTTAGTPTQLAGQELPVPSPQPSRQRQSSEGSFEGSKTDRSIPGRRVPRLCPFNAHRATPYKLVKTYTSKLARGYPIVVRNLPGFLDEQTWFDHATDRDGAFKAPKKSQGEDSRSAFDIFKAILASAATGRTLGAWGLGADPDSANLKAVFDDYEAECKISQTVLEGDSPPLLQFRDWLQDSQFKDDNLDKIVAEVQSTYHIEPQPFIPFKAPLVFFRAVHQYNRDNGALLAETTPSPKDNIAHHQDPEKIHPECISRIQGLVTLTEKITEQFPFPQIVRNIGQSTYETRSCNIRVGVRPLRSSMRRYNGTVVVGQLAGYSAVTLIPPRVNAAGGQPLEFHRRVPQTWQQTTRYRPLIPRNFYLSRYTWSREFEDELCASGDILRATLIPGDGLLVPEGWWCGLRSINYGLQLHATVTWFLRRDELPAEEQKEYDTAKYLEKSATWVRI